MIFENKLCDKKYKKKYFILNFYKQAWLYFILDIKNQNLLIYIIKH
jgi:hypothetical protein